MIKVNIITENISWKNKISNPEKYLKKKIKKLSKKKEFNKKNFEFSILLTNSRKLKKLNFRFRKISKTTDVLSFPNTENKFKKKYLGDIAISYEIINKRSKLSSFIQEFDKIWIHGYLHLLGYDHKKINDFKIMSKKESNLLKYLAK